MTRLPDPRRFGGGPPPAALAACAGGGAECLPQLRRVLEAGDDEAIQALLRNAPAADAYAVAWDLVCAAAQDPADSTPGAVVTRVFALPVILVAAAPGPLTVRGVLADVAPLRSLLEQHGALGATRNFGVSNGLASLDALESLAPGMVYRWTTAGAGAGARDIGAADIHVAGRPEQVHLRFLVGAGLSAAEAPSLAETAATIGSWGMPLGREISRQLAQPGLDLLAIPRPPAPLLRAAHAGRRAQLELAFNLFVSNTLREFRASTGDPSVVLSAHEAPGGGGELRVSLSSMIDEGALEGFRWPLDALDDVAEIERTVRQFLAECRVGDVRTIGAVLPEVLEGGAAFVSVRRADQVARGAAH